MLEIVSKQQTLGRPIISSFATLGLESGSTTSGSVAVYARCDDIFSNRFVANFLENQPVKKF